MDRRRFLLTSLAGAVAAPLAVEAQQAGKVYRVGMLNDIAPRAFPPLAIFERRMAELGYIQGKNLTIDFRTADGHMDRLPSLAAELVRLHPDLIICGSRESATALKRTTRTIPVVFTAVEWDPIALGVVASLAKPGGNFTGFAQLATELGAKRLELLREAVPQAVRIAVLWHRSRSDDQFKATLEAARRLKVQVISMELRDLPHDLDASLKGAAQERADALLVLGSPAFFPERRRLAELAIHHRLPASFQRPAYAEAGGLMSFGADIDDMFRRVADYASRILNGAKPSDLPVEQPTKFELVINLRTAKALGLTIPPSLLARADEVIE
jgi:putative ABC transport system substrate-binding protein